MDEIKKFAKKMGSIGITIWVGSYVFVTCLNYAAERQVGWGMDMSITTFLNQIHHLMLSFKSRLIPFDKNQGVLHLNFQVFRIRMEFLKAILRQDMSWYDMKTTSDFATRMTE